MNTIKEAIKEIHQWRSGHCEDYLRLVFELFDMANDLQLQEFAHNEKMKSRVRAFKMWKAAEDEKQFFLKNMTKDSGLEFSVNRHRVRPNKKDK